MSTKAVCGILQLIHNLDGNFSVESKAVIINSSVPKKLAQNLSWEQTQVLGPSWETPLVTNSITVLTNVLRGYHDDFFN